MIQIKTDTIREIKVEKQVQFRDTIVYVPQKVKKENKIKQFDSAMFIKLIDSLYQPILDSFELSSVPFLFWISLDFSSSSLGAQYSAFGFSISESVSPF